METHLIIIMGWFYKHNVEIALATGVAVSKLLWYYEVRCNIIIAFYVNWSYSWHVSKYDNLYILVCRWKYIQI